MADKLIKNADKLLAAIDDSFILKERNHVMRQMPTFRCEEISLGKVLGIGGFGIVNEVSKITLDKEFKAISAAASFDTNKSPEKSTNHEPQQSGGESAQETTDGTSDDNDQVTTRSKTVSDFSMASSGLGGEDEAQVHYQIHKARQIMERRAVRGGVSRYVIKRLHGSLTKLERARGMVDLALEAKYLSVVWHPNISKLSQRKSSRSMELPQRPLLIYDSLYCFLSFRQSKCGAWGLGLW